MAFKLFLILSFISIAFASDLGREEKKLPPSKITSNAGDPNYAQELLDTAKEVGYELSLEDVEKAKSASTDQEVAESLPMPVAEKLIGHRRKNEMDLLKEQMIGLVFTGKPHPLGSNQGPNRRRFETRPPKHRPRGPPRPPPGFFTAKDLEAPEHILKPYPFIPHPSNVKFPVSPSTRVRRPGPPKSPPRHRPPPRSPKRPLRGHHDEITSHSHVEFKPPSSTRDKFRPDRSPPHHHSDDFFSNTDGPDFGPVTFETIGPKFPDGHFDEIKPPSRPPRIHKKPPQPPRKERPVRPPPFKTTGKQPASGFSSTQFGNFDGNFGQKPGIKDFDDNFVKRPPHVEKEFTSSFGHFDSKPTRKPKPPVRGGFPVRGGGEGQCSKYTEDICLDADNYPTSEILASLIHDPSRADTLMAEVRDQSADDLVDGVTAAQESTYDYTHYFGNRRSDNHAHRDFAEEGGYLCPSEVKYARPKRARNSKNEWKFIVNMDKYTQTIRMEKCMKPGGTCSYVSHHYHATCRQIYNYQRLLSWEKKRGLHMDIFKVPSCCTCHIQGYAYVFPPLGGGKDNHLSFSENVETRVIPGEEINKSAPPYSPINYPNLPEDHRSIAQNPFSKRPAISTPKGHQEESSRPARKRNRSESGPNNGFPDHRVNYGYHPIIDFFNK